MKNNTPPLGEITKVITDALAGDRLTGTPVHDVIMALLITACTIGVSAIRRHSMSEIREVMHECIDFVMDDIDDVSRETVQ